MLVLVTGVLRRTVVGNWRFDKYAGAKVNGYSILLTKSNRSSGFLNFQLTKAITNWLWRWLPRQLLKRQSPITALLKTPVTQMIIFNQGMSLLGSNHFLIIIILFMYNLFVLFPNTKVIPVSHCCELEIASWLIFACWFFDWNPVLFFSCF